MKNKFNILIFVAMGIIFFTSCKKDPDLRMPGLQKSVVPLLTKDAAKNQTIDYFNLATFQGGVVVDLFYPDKPKNMDIKVAYKGNARITGVLQAGITSFPTTVNFDINTLATAVGKTVVSLVPGDFFRVYAESTLDDGTVLSGLDTLYVPFNNSVTLLPGSSLRQDFTIVCPLVLADFVGDYDMSDGYDSDDCVITIALDPAKANGLILTNFYAGTGITGSLPIKLEINMTTYGVTLNPASQVFCATLWGALNLNGTLSNMSGLMDPCTGSFSFAADLTMSRGSYGRQSYVCTPH